MYINNQLFTQAIQILKNNSPEAYLLNDNKMILIDMLLSYNHFKALTYQSSHHQIQIEQCLEFIRFKHYQKGQFIFHKDESGFQMFFLMKGRVSLWEPKSDSELNEEMEIRGRIQELSGILRSQVFTNINEMKKLQYEHELLTEKLNKQYQEEKIRLMHGDSRYFPAKNNICSFKLMREVYEGYSFGEISLLTGKKLKHTALALEDSDMFYLNQHEYLKIFNLEIDKYNYLMGILMKLFPHALISSLSKVVYDFHEVFYDFKQNIYKEGESSTQFFLVSRGEVELRKIVEIQQKNRDQWNEIEETVPLKKNSFIMKKEIIIDKIGPDQIFGLEDCFKKQGRSVSAICSESNTMIYAIRYKIFKNIVGFNQDWMLELGMKRQSNNKNKFYNTRTNNLKHFQKVIEEYKDNQSKRLEEGQNNYGSVKFNTFVDQLFNNRDRLVLENQLKNFIEMKKSKIKYQNQTDYSTPVIQSLSQQQLINQNINENNLEEGDQKLTKKIENKIMQSKTISEEPIEQQLDDIDESLSYDQKILRMIKYNQKVCRRNIEKFGAQNFVKFTIDGEKMNPEDIKNNYLFRTKRQKYKQFCDRPSLNGQHQLYSQMMKILSNSTVNQSNNASSIKLTTSGLQVDKIPLQIYSPIEDSNLSTTSPKNYSFSSNRSRVITSIKGSKKMKQFTFNNIEDTNINPHQNNNLKTILVLSPVNKGEVNQQQGTIQCLKRQSNSCKNIDFSQALIKQQQQKQEQLHKREPILLKKQIQLNVNQSQSISNKSILSNQSPPPKYNNNSIIINQEYYSHKTQNEENQNNDIENYQQKQNVGNNQSNIASRPSSYITFQHQKARKISNKNSNKQDILSNIKHKLYKNLHQQIRQTQH